MGQSKLAVIIPVLNELKNDLFFKNLKVLKEIKGIEVIIVDGGSKDGTQERVQSDCSKLIRTTASSRAERINKGVAAANSIWILINHPRSLIDKKGVLWLLRFGPQEKKWGGFTHQFDLEHPLLKFTSWYSNKIRAKFGKIVYLDHCLFFRKEDFIKIGALPRVEIFEDTVLSKRLAKECGKPEILNFISKTSSVRFQQRGIWRQALLNQWLKACFYLGLDHRKMNQIYERETQLNSKYDD